MSFIRPVQDRITQEWGDNPGFYAQFGQKGHTGIDYGTPLRTPVKASSSGTVVFAGDGSANSGFTWIAGNCILIDHGKIFSAYSHLSQINVRKGQAVNQGDVIGLSGDTGYVSGPHLHFEFWGKPTNWQNGWSGRLNPNDYLTKGNDQVLQDNQRHYDLISTTWAAATGRKLTREEYRGHFVGKDWEALLLIHQTEETAAWYELAQLGKKAKAEGWSKPGGADKELAEVKSMFKKLAS